MMYNTYFDNIENDIAFITTVKLTACSVRRDLGTQYSTFMVHSRYIHSTLKDAKAY